MICKNKEVAIVLAGTNPHVELISKLKKRNFYVLLFDQADNPPGKEICDEYFQISFLEKEKILKIAHERQAKLVISAAAERAHAVACYISEARNQYVPYSYVTAIRISNKVSLKSSMIEFQLPTSNFLIINNYNEFDNNNKLCFPLVVKPSDGYGSRGIHVYHNKKDLKQGLKSNISLNNSTPVIIEEYLEGREFGVYCFLDQIKANIIFINEKIKAHNLDELPAFGTISNPDLEPGTIKIFNNIANSIMQYFSLKNTPLLIQLIKTNEGIKILEFTPRLGGGVSYKTVKIQTGFDFIEASIDSFMGIQHKQNYKNHNFQVTDSGIYAKPGIFSKIIGYDRLIKEGIIEDIVLYKNLGMPVGHDFSSSSRVGAFIIKSYSKEELYEKIDQAYKTIDVYDIEGKSILLRDFHINKNCY